MSKNIAIVVIVTISLASNALLAYKLKHQKEASINTAPQFPTWNAQTNEDLDILKSSLLAHYENESTQLNGDTELVDDHNRKISLNDIVAGKSKFVLRVPAAACDICFDEIFKEIKVQMDSIHLDNFVVIADLPKMRETANFLAASDSHVSIYGIRPEGLGLSPEKSNSPFFFIIDSSIRGRNFLFPARTILDVNKRYFNKLKRKL